MTANKTAQKSAKILIVNGSLGGSAGNTAQVASMINTLLPTKWSDVSHGGSCQVQALHLRDQLSEMIPSSPPNLSVHSHGPDLRGLKDSWLQQLEWADALVFTTGTYWDSWGSPLQIFLEQVTSSEGTALWLGKPALVAVTMHSVGGKSVLSRLQSVLSSFGAMIAPMTGIAYSMTGHEMLKSSERDDSFDDDIWSLEDLHPMTENFTIALNAKLSGHLNFRAWPVDDRDPARRWLKIKNLSKENA